MADWLPVVGTLAGAVVAGGLSIVLHNASNKHAARILDKNLSEERARWAVEYELDQIQKFYGTIERLLDAASAFRIQQAWGRTDDSPPSWVLSERDACEAVENARRSAHLEALLLNDDVISEKAHPDGSGSINIL